MEKKSKRAAGEKKGGGGVGVSLLLLSFHTRTYITSSGNRINSPGLCNYPVRLNQARSQVAPPTTLDEVHTEHLIRGVTVRL